jgi:PAS domain S-box-containing protein
MPNAENPVDERLADFAELGKGVFEGSPDCVKLLDADGHVVAMNRNGQCAMEIDDFQTVRGAHWSTLWTAEGKQSINASVAAARNGQSSSFNAFCPTAKGTARWWEVTVSPILGEAGQVERILSVSRDVTEVQIANEQIRRSEARFRSLVTATTAIVWGSAGNGEFDAEQPGWTAFTGMAFDRFQGLGWLDAIHADDRAHSSASWAAAIATGTLYEVEHRLQRADGQFRYMSVRAVPIFAPDGTVNEWVGVHTDIHDRKASEAILRDNEERVRLATESAELGLWAWHPGTDEVVWENDRPYAIFGLAKNTAPITARRFLTEFVHPDHIAEFGRAVTATIETGARLHFQARIRRSDGILRWVEFFGNLQPQIDGDPLRIIGTVADITANKESEEELRRLAANLSEADRRKTEFLAVLAHELRNPLAPIRQGLHLMQTQADNRETVTRVREMLDRQINQMVRLVNDLLDVARITSGKVELQKQPAEIADLIKVAVETSLPLIEAARHRLTVTVPPASLMVFVDPARIAQVVSNLLNNAAKYTPAGGTIDLRVTHTDSDVMIAVTDNGVGIAPQSLGSVFDLFRQVGQDFERTQGGLGIGLSLVRQLVEMHGGTAQADSPGEGRGSTFTIRLALIGGTASKGAVHPDDQQQQGIARATSLRILIADDNSDAAEILSLLLQASGHVTGVAYNGHDALNLASDFRPDVIFLDIGMPGMNGYEVAKALRQRPQMAKVVLIALTGWGGEQDRAMSNQAGFDHHLIKPVDLDAIEVLLSGLMLQPADGPLATFSRTC